MQQLLIIFAELLLLYFLSRHLINVMFTLLVTLTHSHGFGRAVITVLFLPGTIIHELAHWIVAEILRVSTGEISFVPQVEKRANGQEYIKLGHVAVAETDPVRRYLIGFAPIVIGVFFLSLILWLFSIYAPSVTDRCMYIAFTILAGYLLFSLSNNMFSSRKDLEGFIFVIPFIILLGVIVYVSGIQITLTGRSLAFYLTVTQGLMTSLAIVIGINALILLLNGLVLRTLYKLRARS